jgi:hypothetical protein
MMTSEVLEVALDYLARGWSPIDLPARSKNPGRVGWQHEHLTAAEVAHRLGQGEQPRGIAGRAVRWAGRC